MTVLSDWCLYPSLAMTAAVLSGDGGTPAAATMTSHCRRPAFLDVHNYRPAR